MLVYGVRVSFPVLLLVLKIGVMVVLTNCVGSGFLVCFTFISGLIQFFWFFGHVLGEAWQAEFVAIYGVRALCGVF